ncbi:MAG: GntR family transcriptional regulator, partial [Prosthecobacter sp.]|nr:GntR family transcriptional regulator [Prosthecobacter sp.]
MQTSTLIASRSDSAASQLRTDILSGTAGPGTLLAESAVALRLGVSRVPVREALFALEREGLVEFSTTGRAFVKKLTPQDFEELFVLRLTLEPLASRLAAPKLKESA